MQYRVVRIRLLKLIILSKFLLLKETRFEFSVKCKCFSFLFSSLTKNNKKVTTLAIFQSSFKLI